MAALWNRAGHYIFALWFLSSIFFSSPNLSGRRLDVYHTSTQTAFYTWCGPSVNLECRSEMCCVWLAGNAGPKKSPSGYHCTTLPGYIFATNAPIDNRKKLVKQQYLLHMFSQYGELRPTNGWDRFGSLGHPCKFQWVSRLGSITARHSRIGHQPNFAALNRGRHLYCAGQPSRWALAHISNFFTVFM